MRRGHEAWTPHNRNKPSLPRTLHVRPHWGPSLEAGGEPMVTGDGREIVPFRVLFVFLLLLLLLLLLLMYLLRTWRRIAFWAVENSAS